MDRPTPTPVPPTPLPSILDKVRGLLAKAESTEFPADAEALTAKAQQLMARHRIEQAAVEGRARDGRRPTMVQLTIDAPHADAKVRILIAVAQANTCTVIWTPGLRRASIFGFDDDIAGVETLFTSLLLQATVAVRRAGSRRDAAGRNRTVSFRRSFLVAFAARIGERLRTAVDAEVAAAGAGTDLARCLDRRAEAVVAAAREAFPATRPMSTSIGSADGWHEGRRCADRADLGGTAGFGRLSA